MKILSNKKYNDLISKQFRGIFADVNDDNLLRENGLLYGENKELQKEIERLNNIIKEQGLEDKSNYYVKGLEGSLKEYQDEVKRLNNIINEALGIANERFNYYSNHKNNNQEHLEDWGNIFNILLRRDDK